MTQTKFNPLVAIAAVLFLVVPIVAVSGSYVRSVVLTAQSGQERTRNARAALDAALTAQLDEETGIRGFAATRDRSFLEPYTAAAPRFEATLANLQAALSAVGLPGSAADVDELRRTHEQWTQRVVGPLLAADGRPSLAVQRRGKTLIDHYRAVVGRLGDSLAARRAQLDAEAVVAVDRVTQFVVIATLVVLLVALAFGIQQRRLAQRLEAERREAAETRAAYLTEKRISDTLQEAFSLKPMPDVPRVRLSGIYVPATEETRVGGDWYDAVEVEAGRVMFTIGDVAGHGLAAAVAMNQTRQSMLAAALGTRDPADLLDRVNQELVNGERTMVTAVCGYADANHFTFTYASAGHPPPILFEPGRSARMLEFGGMPLGVAANATYRSHTVQTIPGAMLVLYTDGAVEHSRDLFEGERVLLEAIARSTQADGETAAAFIRDSIFTGRSAADDVAIVTVTFAEASGRAGRGRAAADVQVAASGPDAGPGAVISISPRSLHRLIASLERLAS